MGSSRKATPGKTQKPSSRVLLKPARHENRLRQARLPALDSRAQPGNAHQPHDPQADKGMHGVRSDGQRNPPDDY